MGFLKNFFTNALREESTQAPPRNSFEHLSEDELEAHLRVAKYGNFTLTDAVRPSYDLKVVPSEGFRHELYEGEEAEGKMPVLMCSASSERLFEIFMELLDPLGNVVDVVLETSHDRSSRGHQDLYREHIDMPVLKSILWDYEELLTHDGCTGVAVLNPRVPVEVQLDEHKLIIAYGHALSQFEGVLESRGVYCNEEMRFITEAEHVHSSCERYLEEFERLKTDLGMDSGY